MSYRRYCQAREGEAEKSDKWNGRKVRNRLAFDSSDAEKPNGVSRSLTCASPLTDIRSMCRAPDWPGDKSYIEWLNGLLVEGSKIPSVIRSSVVISGAGQTGL